MYYVDIYLLPTYNVPSPWNYNVDKIKIIIYSEKWCYGTWNEMSEIFVGTPALLWWV